MVTAGKVFVVAEETDLDSIALKFRDYKAEDVYEYNGKSIDLLTEIKDLTMSADSLQGVFNQDQIFNLYHHGQLTPTPKTIEAPFLFTKLPGKLFLTILEKKQRANNIANAFSKILFITTGHIIEGRIKPEVMQAFHEQNFEDTKIIFFDDVDVPNVDKLSLYGSALANTSLYTDYLHHGKIWYIVIKAKKYGYVVGVTRNCVITTFSTVEEPDFITYVENEIFPLIV